MQKQGYAETPYCKAGMTHELKLEDPGMRMMHPAVFPYTEVRAGLPETSFVWL